MRGKNSVIAEEAILKIDRRNEELSEWSWREKEKGTKNAGCGCEQGKF
nr:hypothetical protein [uncultured Acetatifactor sp.]